MHKIVGIPELRQRLHDIVEEVVQEHTAYLVERDSHPEAALVSYQDYLRLQALKEQEVLSRFNAAWRRIGEQNAHLTEEEVDRIVAETEAELRAEQTRQAS